MALHYEEILSLARAGGGINQSELRHLLKWRHLPLCSGAIVVLRNIEGDAFII